MGLFFKDYESAGPGISNHAPRKKGLALYWDLLARKFWTLFGVNMLYTLFWLPIFAIFVSISFIKNSDVVIVISALCLLAFSILIGPATAGMTKVMRLFIIEKHTFVIRDFFRGFKQNFKNGLSVGLLDVLVFLSVFAAYNVYPGFAVQYESKVFYIPMVITFSVGLIVLFMNNYIYLMMVATNLSLKNLIKNSFSLSFIGAKPNIISLIISVLAWAIMLLIFLFAPVVFLMLIPFVPAAFLWFTTCFNCYPVIQKYVIDPYYEAQGEINPERITSSPDDEEPVFKDMGGKEKPIEKRKKSKGRRIS